MTQGVYGPIMLGMASRDRENTWTHLARVNRARRARIENRPDTPEEIRERIASNQAAPLAVADREARFPVLTAENAAEAIRFQEERLQFHKAAILGGAKSWPIGPDSGLEISQRRISAGPPSLANDVAKAQEVTPLRSQRRITCTGTESAKVPGAYR